MKILVAGHTGAIGSEVYKAIQKNSKFEVFGASLSTGYDFTDPKTISRLPAVEWVLNFTGLAGVQESYQRPSEFYFQNVSGTLHLLEYCRLRSSRLLHLSSYLYGDPSKLPIDENHPIQGKSPYAQSKIAAENLCIDYAHFFNLNIVSLRPFNLYGPSITKKGLIAHLLNQMDSGETVTVQDSRPKRDYLHTDDLILLIQKILSERPQGFQCYNLGYGQSWSVREVVDLIKQVSGKSTNFVDLQNPRPNEIQDCFADTTKLSKIFGFKPSIDLKTGLTNLIRHRGVR